MLTGTNVSSEVEEEQRKQGNQEKQKNESLIDLSEGEIAHFVFRIYAVYVRRKLFTRRPVNSDG